MLEMACALALFSLLSMVLVHGYNHIVFCQLSIWHYHEAWSLARIILEKARIGEWPLGHFTYKDYTVLVYKEPYNTRQVAAFNQITVHISWMQKGISTKRAVMLTGGMINHA